MVYQSEKTLADMGDKIEAEDKQAIESALEKVKNELKGKDTQAIKDAVGELEKAFYAASEKLYSQVNPQGDPNAPYGDGSGEQGGSPDDGGGGDFYDADYEVVDDNGDD